MKKNKFVESSFQNPVLSVLFCTKHGKVDVKTEDDLREIAPSKLYEEHLFVLCRSGTIQPKIHITFSLQEEQHSNRRKGKGNGEELG